MATINAPVFVDGTIQAGNIQSGVTTVTPVPNTPTSATVSGLSLSGTGDLYVQLTPISAFPGETVQGVGVTNVTGASFDIVIMRTTDTPTQIFWFVTRDP
jgi:hypothetical protein